MYYYEMVYFRKAEHNYHLANLAIRVGTVRKVPVRCQCIVRPLLFRIGLRAQNQTSVTASNTTGYVSAKVIHNARALYTALSSSANVSPDCGKLDDLGEGGYQGINSIG